MLHKTDFTKNIYNNKKHSESENLYQGSLFSRQYFIFKVIISYFAYKHYVGVDNG